MVIKHTTHAGQFVHASLTVTDRAKVNTLALLQEDSYKEEHCRECNLNQHTFFPGAVKMV